MPFSSRNKLPSNTPPANALASQSTTQQPQPVCTWSAHGPQSGPFPRLSHTLTANATAAGELFLFGGLVHGCASSDLYMCSTRDFSITLLRTRGESPTPRAAHCATLIDTTLLICGGKVGASEQNVLNHDSFYLLNLVSREWSRVVVNGPGPGAGRCYHTTTVVGSKLFVFGGQIGRKAVNDMWTLDLNCLNSQPLWEPYGPTPGNEKPLPRSCHVSVTTGSRIIIFGGYGDHHYNDTWSFDILTQKWTELQCTGSIPSPRGGHAAVLVNDVMYVFGGFKGNTYLDDIIALQLSTQRWFKFDNVGPSPHRRAYHTMASDGTRVFVLGGYSKGAQSDEISLIHVFDSKDIKYPQPERNVVNLNEKTIQLAWMSSAGPPTLEQPQHSKYSSSRVHGASGLQNATPALPGSVASLQITHERGPGLNSRPLELTGENSKPSHVPEVDASEGSTEYHAKPATPDSSSEGEVTRLELERQLSVLLAAQAERGQLIARQTDELAKKSILLEQAEAIAAEEKRRTRLELREHEDRLLVQTSIVKQRDAALVDMQSKLRSTEAKLDELLLSSDRQVGQYKKELTNVDCKLEAKESELTEVRLRVPDAEKKLALLEELVASRNQELANVRDKLEAKESELEAVLLRLADAEKGSTSLVGLVVSRDQQVERYEKELANMRAKLEAKESDLEAVRSRLTDAEKDLSKAKAGTLRAKNATGSVDKDEDQLTRRLMDRMRAMMEAEMASKRWKEKEEECTNE